MRFIPYDPRYQNQVIGLVLYLQNFENRAELSLTDQPELADIPEYFFPGGGASGSPSTKRTTASWEPSA